MSGTSIATHKSNYMVFRSMTKFHMQALPGKYAPPFPIIADQEARWVRALRSSYENGKSHPRKFSSFSPDGRVNKIYPNVDPGTHAALVLADVRNQIGLIHVSIPHQTALVELIGMTE